MEHQSGDSVAPSLNDAWQHFQAIPKAGSFAEGWDAVKQSVDATPAWALVVAILVGLTLVTNAWIVPALLVIGGTLTAAFYVVKHAVRVALREHESHQR